jgi:hypothetical protein
MNAPNRITGLVVQESGFVTAEKTKNSRSAPGSRGAGLAGLRAAPFANHSSHARARAKGGAHEGETLTVLQADTSPLRLKRNTRPNPWHLTHTRREQS